MIHWRTWTALLALGGLTACADGGTGGGFGFLPSAQEAPAAQGGSVLRQTTLLDGQLAISAPANYCIDSTSLSGTARRGFVLMASCNILTGGSQGANVDPVIVTVAARKLNTPTLTADDLIAAQGTTGSTRRASDPAIVQFASGGETAFDGSDPRMWRGGFARDGVTVTLALYAPKGSGFAGSAGGAFLETVSSRMRVTKGATQSTAPRAAATRQTAPQSDAGEPLLAQLGRLFGGPDLQ